MEVARDFDLRFDFKQRAESLPKNSMKVFARVSTIAFGNVAWD